MTNFSAAGDVVPPSGRYPDIFPSDEGVRWVFGKNVTCYMDQDEGSNSNTIFYVEYDVVNNWGDRQSYFFAEPYANEYSCQSTLRNNKNFKPSNFALDGLQLARCVGSPEDCRVYKAQ